MYLLLGNQFNRRPFLLWAASFYFKKNSLTQPVNTYPKTCWARCREGLQVSSGMSKCTYLHEPSWDKLTDFYLPRSGTVQKAQVGTCDTGFKTWLSLPSSFLNWPVNFFKKTTINAYQFTFSVEDAIIDISRLLISTFCSPAYSPQYDTNHNLFLVSCLRNALSCFQQWQEKLQCNWKMTSIVQYTFKCNIKICHCWHDEMTALLAFL